MQVPELLLGALQDLLDDDFKTFKWYLSVKVLDSCAPIPKSRLENTSRPDTVSKIIESYGEELAVDITVQILRKIGMNNIATELEGARKVGRTSAPSSSFTAAAAAMPELFAWMGGGASGKPNVISGSRNKIKGSGNKVSGHGNVIIN